MLDEANARTCRSRSDRCGSKGGKGAPASPGAGVCLHARQAPLGQTLGSGEALALIGAEPAFGHDGLGMAFGAQHHRLAVRFVAGGAVLGSVLGSVRIERVLVRRELDQIGAIDIVARLVQAEGVAIDAARLGEVGKRALVERRVEIAGHPRRRFPHLLAERGDVT